MSIYLDNANSTHPKPKEVINAVYNTISNFDVIPSDGFLNNMQKNSAKLVSSVKKNAAEFFGVKHDNIMVTTSASKGLSCIMSTFLEPGDKLVVCEADSTPLLRMVREMEKKGVSVVKVPYEKSQGISMTILKKAIAGARMLALSHSNNITGAVLPVEEISKLASDNHTIFLLDVSHTAGRMPIDLRRLGVSAAVVSGHKFLYGPTGTGLAYVDTESMKNPSMLVRPTRSFSDTLEDETPNILGISGLLASIKFLLNHDLGKIRQHDKQIRESMLGSLELCKRVKLLVPDSNENVATMSFVSKSYPPNVLARLLEERYDIMVGNGLCQNKGIHESISTLPDGVVRISAGYLNSQSDIEYFGSSLTSILYS
jgi:selenocysteine lyase/cysteine desulfurase